MKKPKIEYRKDRDRWGFRYETNGQKRKLYRWNSKDEAEAALDEMWVNLNLPATLLVSAAAAYLKDSAVKRSSFRVEGIKYNLKTRIIPFWGEEKDIREITSEEVEEFVAKHKGRVQNVTIWHYVKDLRAMLNWCIKRKLLKVNPVADADLSLIRNRKAVKPPLDIGAIEKGIEVLRDRERLYADTLRFMGLRKDEGNHVQAKDVMDYGAEMWLKVSYHQSDIKSNRVLPIPSILHEGYRHYLAQAQPDDYILCNNPERKIYDRRRMFSKVSKAAGIEVKPKDLRDYFASIVQDPVIASQMLGHTSLRTTETYVRQVRGRMLEAMEQVTQDKRPKDQKADALRKLKAFVEVMLPESKDRQNVALAQLAKIFFPQGEILEDEKTSTAMENTEKQQIQEPQEGAKLLN